jgi:cytochrome c oxidase subunit 1
MWSSIGGFGFGLSQLLFAYMVWQCARGGVKATDEVWAGAKGLEWTVPSPAPHHTFTVPPVIDDSKLAHGNISH